MNAMASPSSRDSEPEQIEHLRLRRHIETGNDLVGEHEVGREQRRPRDADALALTARQFVRIAVETGEGQAEALEDPARPRVRVAPIGGDAVKQHRLGHDAPDRVARIERGHRILKDHLHAPAQRAHPGFRQPR